MIIGNLPKQGIAVEPKKWYWRIEIRKQPPTMTPDVFKPMLLIALVKWNVIGEYGRVGGRKEERLGGWKTFVFPYGVVIEIIK